MPRIKIDDYPAIKRFLDRHYEQLAKRQDKGATPYNLRNCAYYTEFSKEKLFWIELSDHCRFAYDDNETFCVNSAYMLTGGSLKYLCAVLNSTLVTWFIRNSALNSGMGTARWVRFTVERIPVPVVDDVTLQAFIHAVDALLGPAHSPADTAAKDEAVETLVADLYELADEERRVATSGVASSQVQRSAFSTEAITSDVNP